MSPSERDIHVQLQLFCCTVDDKRVPGDCHIGQLLSPRHVPECTVDVEADATLIVEHAEDVEVCEPVGPKLIAHRDMRAEEVHIRLVILGHANIEVEAPLVEFHQVNLAIKWPAHSQRVGSNHPECGPGSIFATESEARTAAHIDAVSWHICNTEAAGWRGVAAVARCVSARAGVLGLRARTRIGQNRAQHSGDSRESRKCT